MPSPAATSCWSAILEIARLLGVSVYLKRTMLISSCSSDVVLTASLYRSRLCNRERGPNEQPTQLRNSNIANASKHIDCQAIDCLRSKGDTMRNVSTLRNLPIRETGALSQLNLGDRRSEGDCSLSCFFLRFKRKYVNGNC